MTTLYRYRFGDAQFDEARVELVIGGLAVDVQPRPLQLLSVLLNRGGEVVTREELFREVWQGRPTVENVLANAVTKLRNALGPEGAQWIENVPRVGYRFAGAFERVAVGRAFASKLELASGAAVPQRSNFQLQRMLGQSPGHEVWLARHTKTGEQRVFKFAADAEHVRGLKREATLARVLRDQLGERADLVRVIDWNFESAPFFLESAYGGEDLASWSLAGDRLQSLALSARLEIFLQIADALAAAHGVAVLHRDLKPGNVLLEAQGAALRVRLADFGSGRLLDPDQLAELGITAHGLTAATVVSDHATRGTLLYLAPEILQDQPASVRSDIYALGVVLFQLVVCDVRRPLVPGWERSVDDELLREDIARATDGDPARRTNSVAELARNVRELEQRRVARQRQREEQAQTQRDREALRRIQARRPWLVAAVTSLVLGLSVSLFFFVQARASRLALSEQFAIARTLNKFLTSDLIAQANPVTTGRADLSVAAAAKKAAARIDAEFGASAPEVRAALHAAMQEAFTGLSDYQASLEQGEQALAALAAAPLRDARQEAAIRVGLAVPLAQLARLPDAAQALDQAEQSLAAAQAQDAESLMRLWNARGFIAGLRFDFAAAAVAYKKALELSRSNPSPDVDFQDTVAFNLADSLRVAGRFDESESQFRQLLARQSERYGTADARTCYTMVGLASTMDDTDRRDDAAALLQTSAPCLAAALGAGHLRALAAREFLGNVHFYQGRYADAVEVWTDVAPRLAQTLGETSLRVINLRMNLAIGLQFAGRTPQAERVLDAALTAARAKFPAAFPIVQSLRYHLADCRLDMHRTEGVAGLLDGLSSAELNHSEIEPDWDGLLAYQRGRLALAQGDSVTARKLLLAAGEIIAAKNPTSRISQDVIRRLLQQTLPVARPRAT